MSEKFQAAGPVVCRRAQNSLFPEPFAFQSDDFSSLVKLYEAQHPAPLVPLNTFKSRVRRLHERGELTCELVKDALCMPAADYRAKYGARRSYVVVGEERIDLEAWYRSASVPAAVSYSNFRQRIRSLQRGSSVTTEVLRHAKMMKGADWISFYGGGRHHEFLYDGEDYPDLYGQKFHSISAFLKTIGCYAKKGLVWSRIKNGWKLDDALAVPAILPSGRAGLIYKITRLKTGQVYVGLTVCGIEQRWAFHLRAVRAGAMTKLASAIREDGEHGFALEVIEEGIADPNELKSREVFWAVESGAMGDMGLNTAPPGGLGGAKGKPVTVEGEFFHSQTYAANVISNRGGLPTYVIRAKIRAGQPIPEKARKHSKHPEAGSPLFRCRLGILKRHPGAVDAGWVECYDKFKADVSPVPAGHHLVRKDASRPWGPGNFEWLAVKEKIERQHGLSVTVHGVRYPSLTAVAAKFGIGVSTLKDRMRRQGLTVEEAVALPLGVTSCKSGVRTVVEGKAFRSKRQGILYLMQTQGLTEHQAKCAINNGAFRSSESARGGDEPTEPTEPTFAR